jgi:hypothetical protein
MGHKIKAENIISIMGTIWKVCSGYGQSGLFSRISIYLVYFSVIYAGFKRNVEEHG